MRRKRNTNPKMMGGTDQTIIEYSAISTGITSDTNGLVKDSRYYCGGYPNMVAQPVGPSVVENYATYKFLPGTKIRWEPSVSFTSTGRVYVAFTDNPEIMAGFPPITGVNWVNAVKGLGNVISFPVWQETEIPFPIRYRRNRFDTNKTLTGAVDELDRSVQVFMVVAAEGCTVSTTLGSFWFHDKISVEGLHSYIT